MNYNHERIKANARLHYKYNQGNSILVTLIYFAVSFGLGMIINFVTGFIRIITTMIGTMLYVPSEYGYTTAGSFLASIGISFILYWVGYFAIGIFTSLLLYCVLNWYRISIHQDNLNVGIIFDPLKYNFKSNFMTAFLVNLYTWLWTLLFIVPGIIKGYSYSMAYFIKAEHPEIDPQRAIKISEEITYGYKGDLFYLDLSFWGWFLLSALTFNILGIVYVYPYYFAARAFAYEEIKTIAVNKGIAPELSL